MIFKTGQPRYQDIYLILGQSNAVSQTGSFYNMPAEITAVNPMLKVWNAGTFADPTPGKFVPAHAGFNTGVFGYTHPASAFSNEGIYGMESFFGPRFIAEKQKSISFIKEAYGGKFITYFMPGGPSWTRIQAYITDAIAYYEARGIIPVFKAVLWVQGENDGSTPAAYDYNTNLTSLKASVRGINHAYLDTMHWISFKLQNSFEGAFAGIVNTAMADVAAADTTGHTHVLDLETGGVGSLFDRVHYTAPAGIRYASNKAYDLCKTIGII
jgi:hypothetical protein